MEVVVVDEDAQSKRKAASPSEPQAPSSVRRRFVGAFKLDELMHRQ